MKNFLSKFFSNDKDPLNAEKNQKINNFIILISLIVILIAIMMLVSDNKKDEKRDIGNFKIVNEDDMVKTKWVGEAAVNLKVTKRNLEQLSSKNKKLEEEINNLKKMIIDMKNEKKTSGIQQQTNTNNLNEFAKFLDKKSNLYKNYPNPNQNDNKFGLSEIGKVPKIKKTETKYIEVQDSLGYEKIAEPKKKTEKKIKNSPKNIIPTGSIIKTILLSGLDAPTMTQAKTNPLPVLMKVTNLAILPNRWKYNIKECFITGEGYGDLPSERAYIRTNNISCITDKGKHIDMPLKGAATGEDGKLGLRGTVVTKQGALLARTLVAGFLQGVGESFSQQNQIVLTGTNGTTTTTKNLSTSEALQMGAFKGLSESAKKLADFYLKMADQIYPVIEISAGRHINILITQMADLKTVEDNDNKERKKK